MLFWLDLGPNKKKSENIPRKSKKSIRERKKEKIGRCQKMSKNQKI